MPQALVFTLRPLVAGHIPASLGRATHAALLRLIGAQDPALAARIHDDEGTKPLTVSNIAGLQRTGSQAHADPNLRYRLRVTLLDAELEAVAATWQPEQIKTLELEHQAWQIEAIARTPNEDVWAGQTSYEALAAPLLERRDGRGKWRFQLAAPVTFRQRGNNAPLPTTELFFGSLLDRWNALAPIALPDETRRYCEECMVVSRFDLQSVAAPTSGGALQIGALGKIEYLARNNDRYWRAVIETLAQFAFYSGVGRSTTRGFGQVRLIDEHAPASAAR